MKKKLLGGVAEAGSSIPAPSPAKPATGTKRKAGKKAAAEYVVPTFTSHLVPTDPLVLTRYDDTSKRPKTEPTNSADDDLNSSAADLRDHKIKDEEDVSLSSSHHTSTGTPKKTKAKTATDVYKELQAAQQKADTVAEYNDLVEDYAGIVGVIPVDGVPIDEDLGDYPGADEEVSPKLFDTAREFLEAEGEA